MFLIHTFLPVLQNLIYHLFPTPLDTGNNNNRFIWTNQVAPIIIKNCREEFQHITDMKDPVVWGSLADDMIEHPLIRGKYFLLRDVPDRLHISGPMPFCAPNVHRAQGGFPVYATGQPTVKGLSLLLENLIDDGYKEIFLFNVREEPVLFVKNGEDFTSYSLHDQENMSDCVLAGRNAKDANEFEAKIRKEIIDIAIMQDENKFYFYDDLENLESEPHQLPVQHEDNILVAEEVYARLMFSSRNIWYRRLCFPLESAPSETDVDSFIQVFKESPCLFDMERLRCPAMLFICQTGSGRSTVGMVMGCLLLAHRKGFTSKSNKSWQSIDDRNPDYAKGEYIAIQQLIKLLPNGLHIKSQVDEAIDMCSELCNLRLEIMQSKELLEVITTDYIIEGTSAKAVLYERCVNYLHRYYFLICFNSYLNEQYFTEKVTGP